MIARQRIGATTVALSLLLAGGPAAAWQARVEGDGLRIAETQGEAQVGDRRSNAALELRCLPGEQGTLQWLLRIEQASALGFDFQRFEGPQTEAAEQRFGSLSLEGGLLRPRIAPVALQGHSEGTDTFVLGFAAPALAGAEGALLADSIGPQSKALIWTVAAPNPSGLALLAQFSLTDAAAAVRETMAGCGPAPPIGATLLDAWRGRNPHAIDWFAQRPVLWRLKGLLGARYDGVLARLGSAEPIGIEQETVFVLAPAKDAPRDGVAILVQGENTEVVLIDDGVVERLVAGRSAIALPGAVREFVVERSAAGG